MNIQSNKTWLRNLIVFGAVFSPLFGISFGERIDIQSKVSEYELGGRLDILVVAHVIDGDLEVVSENRQNIELSIDDFDWEDRDTSQAWVEFDRDQGVFKLQLRRELIESDVRIRVPERVSLRVRVDDGDIRISGTKGEIDASAVDGDIVMLEVQGGVVANTVDGDFRVSLADAPLVNPISLATVDGDIELVLTRAIDAEISASTIDGSFETAFAIVSTIEGKHGRNRNDGVRIQGRMGKGGPLISLKTIDGDIEIVESN